MFGGQDAASPRNDLWEYSFDRREWTELNPSGTLPPARFGHTTVFDPVRRRLVLFGGQAAGFFSDVWAYDIAQNTWQQLSPTRPVRTAGMVIRRFTMLREIALSSRTGLRPPADSMTLGPMSWGQTLGGRSRLPASGHSLAAYTTRFTTKETDKCWMASNLATDSQDFQNNRERLIEIGYHGGPGNERRLLFLSYSLAARV